MAAERTTRERRIGILQQADFATPSAADAAFETLNYDAGSVIPNGNVVLNTHDITSTSGLIAKQSRAYTDAVSGLKSIAFSGTATKKALAPHFVAALQSVTEGATSPYQKTIVPAFNTSIVDFSSAGYLYTVATDNINGSDGIILESAVLGDFTFSVNPNADGVARLAKISGNWVGNEMNYNQNLSGSWVAESFTGFYNNSTALAMDVATWATLSSVCYKSYSLTINNNVTSDCRVAGKANNYKFSPVITVNIVLPYDSNTYGLLNAYNSGTTGSIQLKVGTTGQDGYLSILSYGRISATPFGTDGAYETINLTQTVEFNTSASKSLEIVIADDNDRSYSVA